MSKIATEPEPITETEGEILDKVFMGGLSYHEIYKGFGVLYDINSMYPSLLIDPKFMIPMVAGTPTKLTIEEFESNRARNYFKYGIYRCNIEGTHKLFKPNRANHYTHYDLTCANELGLKISLIEDDEFNYYAYDKEGLVQSRKLFSEYVNYFYELKSKCKIAKALLNCLWGGLTTRKQVKKVVNRDIDAKLDEDLNITSLNPIDDETLLVTMEKPQNRFQNDFARVGVFLTSYARLKMMRHAKPYQDNIIRIHTDSILLNEDLKVNFDVNNEIGSWKLEGKGQVDIKHLNSCKFIE